MKFAVCQHASIASTLLKPQRSIVGCLIIAGFLSDVFANSLLQRCTGMPSIFSTRTTDTIPFSCAPWNTGLTRSSSLYVCARPRHGSRVFLAVRARGNGVRSVISRTASTTASGEQDTPLRSSNESKGGVFSFMGSIEKSMSKLFGNLVAKASSSRCYQVLEAALPLLAQELGDDLRAGDPAEELQAMDAKAGEPRARVAVTFAVEGPRGGGLARAEAFVTMGMEDDVELLAVSLDGRPLGRSAAAPPAPGGRGRRGDRKVRSQKATGFGNVP